MANDTAQIMQTMNMSLGYEGEIVRDQKGRIIGIKPSPLGQSVFYAEVLGNGSIAFSIRTGEQIDAHGVIPELTYNGYDYFADLLQNIDSSHRG